MTWRSFMDYYLMVELGQQDSICRNYRLDFITKSHNLKLAKALRANRVSQRIGIGPNTDPMIIIGTVIARLRGMGYTTDNQVQVWNRLNEWYTWDRIRTGDIRRWPLKCGPDGRQK